MKNKDVLKLQAGDQVFWNDPDDGIGSRYYEIKTIEVKGSIICITDVNGDYLECFAKELS